MSQTKKYGGIFRVCKTVDTGKYFVQKYMLNTEDEVKNELFWIKCSKYLNTIEAAEDHATIKYDIITQQKNYEVVSE